MQAITPRREHHGGGAAPRDVFDREMVARLRPLADLFTDGDLERMERGDGPLVYMLLDADGLPISGVICDPDTGRRTKFRLPMAAEVVA